MSTVDVFCTFPLPFPFLEVGGDCKSGRGTFAREGNDFDVHGILSSSSLDLSDSKLGLKSSPLSSQPSMELSASLLLL